MKSLPISPKFEVLFWWIVFEKKLITAKKTDAVITEYEGMSNQFTLSFIVMDSFKSEFKKNTENIKTLKIINIPLIWPPLKAAKNLKNITPNTKKIKIRVIEGISKIFMKLIFNKKKIIPKPQLITTKLVIRNKVAL